MKIASVVLNNFLNDNRVYKMATTLEQMGNDVIVVAFWRKGLAIRENFKGIEVHRIFLRSLSLPRNTFFGIFKYIEFCLKAIYIYRKYDVWHCNDFEAFLVGCFAKITRPRLQLVYDSHEYQKEKYGISEFSRWFIGAFERVFIHWASEVITVGIGIEKEYKRLYGLKNVEVIYNAPHKMDIQASNILRESLHIPNERKVFLYQGKFSRGRGIELLVQTFSHLNGSRNCIVFMGDGDLQSLIEDGQSKSDAIYTLPSVPYHDILRYSASADVGMVSTQNVCLNNYYAMPNKLFEYIHAGLPILTNNLHDCAALVKEEQIGDVIAEYSETELLAAIERIEHVDLLNLRENLKKAQTKYNWENEELKLKKIYYRLQS